MAPNAAPVNDNPNHDRKLLARGGCLRYPFRMTYEEAQRLCNEFAAKMHEHFDHVQILVTWNEEGNTHRIAHGAGNWYARQGMAHEFINMDIAQDTAFQIADKLKSDGDDGDDWKARSES